MTGRLMVDRVPAPVGECQCPGASRCCAVRVTMHSSGLCSWCGDWVTDIDAGCLRAGDLVLDGPLWAEVAGVEFDRSGAIVIVDLGYRHWTLHTHQTVTVAAHQRPAVAADVALVPLEVA